MLMKPKRINSITIPRYYRKHDTYARIDFQRNGKFYGEYFSNHIWLNGNDGGLIYVETDIDLVSSGRFSTPWEPIMPEEYYKERSAVIKRLLRNGLSSRASRPKLSAEDKPSVKKNFFEWLSKMFEDDTIPSEEIQIIERED